VPTARCVQNGTADLLRRHYKRDSSESLLWFWTWIIAPDYARADFGSLKTSAKVSAVDLRSFMRGWGSRIANCQIFDTTLPKGRLSTSWRRASAASSNGNLFATMGGDRVFRPLRSRQLHDCVPDRTSDRRRFDPGQRRGTARLESNFNLWRTDRCRRRHLPCSGRRGLSLAEVAIGAGFSDQSQLCFHFKRIVGVTPGRFRASAKIT
jgi:AraC-like DNA-binding protein